MTYWDWPLMEFLDAIVFVWITLSKYNFCGLKFVVFHRFADCISLCSFFQGCYFSESCRFNRWKIQNSIISSYHGWTGRNELALQFHLLLLTLFLCGDSYSNFFFFSIILHRPRLRMRQTLIVYRSWQTFTDLEFIMPRYAAKKRVNSEMASFILFWHQ